MFDNLLSTISLNGNWFDLIVLTVVFFFAFTSGGFIRSFLELLSLIFAFIFSFGVYGFFSKLLILNFSLTKGIAKSMGFFISWMIAEFIFYALAHYVVKYLPKPSEKYNRVLGFIPAILQALILLGFIATLFIALPVRGGVKKDILSSQTGPHLLRISQVFESKLKTVFGDALFETLNFITVKPKTGETVDLDISVDEKELKFDTSDEASMFSLVNKERTKEKIEILGFDRKLQKVARDYAVEMFSHGFFSHTSKIDGSTPADRVSRQGIRYRVVGENLAYAPDLIIAHTGLMNSPGHRANILSSDFGKVGIGVADGGVYGKIYVQVFTN